VTFPSHTDETANRASRAIGGKWGRYAGVRASSMWTPLRVVLAVACFTLLLGFAQKSPCANGQWTGFKQYTHMCYSDVVPLWSAERLDQGGVPYRDTTVEYPVLTGTMMWATGELTRGVMSITHTFTDIVVFGGLTAVLLSVCGLFVAAGIVGANKRRPYDAMIFAAAPLLVFHAFSNWDLLAMALTSGALWAWATRRPVLAGALIGLGAAAKLYPAFLLVAIVTLAIRTRKYAPAVWCTLTAGFVWLAVNMPIAIAYHAGWSKFYTFSQERPTERSTVWAMVKTLVSSHVSASDAPYWVPPGTAVALVLIVALLGVVWLGLYAPTRPRLAQLAFLAVLAFLLTTKVWSPQYSLWLVPLLALARPRWRITLVWQFVEIAVWFLTLTLLLGESGQPQHGINYGWLMLVLVIRDALLIAMAVMIVREMWYPELDIVRADGSDDPGGGFFDGVPDSPRYSYAEFDEFDDRADVDNDARTVRVT